MPKPAARTKAAREPLGLTRRELEVAALVSQGQTNREIAGQLAISERTVDGHLERIREKLGVNSRTQVAMWFVGVPSGVKPEVPRPEESRWPVEPTRLFGRERELAELRDLILRSDVRLVTLTGAPGTGKTRLASSAARDLVGEYPDGCRFVDLSPVADANLVVPAIAQVVGARAQVEAVTSAIGSRRMLLLIDNFDQVLGAARVVAVLLASCPNLKVLVTSRECLHLLRWEHEYQVETLPLPELVPSPSAESVMTNAAVALFVDRAQARNPRFNLTNESAETVARICTRLDGLPLAIELAAAGVRTRTPAAMLSSLLQGSETAPVGGIDFPERHQTLGRAIASSYALLSNQERIVFTRLSCFVGGFDTTAAEGVCVGGAVGPGQVDATLARLVDKSLIQVVHGGGRFRFLETIRQFAADQLMRRGEAESVSARHREYFVGFAEAALSDLHGPTEPALFDRLTLDLDNFRAVFAWAMESGGIEEGLRLGSALSQFWGWRGLVAEGCRLLAYFVDQADDTQLAKFPVALRELGYLEGRRGGPAAGRKYLERYLVQAREIGDHRGAAMAQFYLGEGIYLGQAKWDVATLHASRALLEGALISARLADFRPIVGYALRALGMVAHLEGKQSEAGRLLDNSMSIADDLQDRRSRAVGLLFRGRIAFDQAEYGLAIDSFIESLEISRGGGYFLTIATPLEWLARLAVIRGVRVTALRLAGAAAGWRDVHEENSYRFWNLDFDRYIDTIAGGDARSHPMWLAGREMRLDDVVQLARGLVGASLSAGPSTPA